MLADFHSLPEESRIWLYAREKALTQSQQDYILNIIDKRKNKKEHFCSSGSSGIHEDTQHQT